jgi:ferric enterobactin receptor
MMKPYLLVFLIPLLISHQAFSQQRTKKLLKKVVVDHFYTCTLDAMLDSISMENHLPIYFEREPLSHMNVANHFFNESLKDVLRFVCKTNELQYWIENDGTVFILQKPDDLPRLRQLKQLRNTTMKTEAIKLPPSKMPPVHYGFSITGKVIDVNTGESLPGATIKIRNTDMSTVTNTSGNFTMLKVPSDTVVAEVSFVGYQPDAFRLNSKSIDSSLVFPLAPSMNALNEVTVTGKKAGVLNTDSKKVSVLQLTPAALDKLPNIGERDVMRAFQLMPGVSATNESSSGAYVRGGTPDQNLVTFDGFTVYQVDHLYGFFSAFNSNAVRDVQLFKGGFSAKYGGRLSSVTEIIGKDGNKNETNAGGDVSLLSTNLYVETPVGNKSSLLVSFRRSYQGPLYDKIFSKFNTTLSFAGPAGGGGFGGRGGGGFGAQVTPSSYFSDVNAKYVYTLSPKNNLAISFYNGSDHLDNSRDMNLPSFATGISTSLKVTDNQTSANTGASLKWGTVIGRNLFANTTLSYSGFYSDRNQSTNGSATDSGITKTINLGTREYNQLYDRSAKSDWEWRQSSTVKWLFGGYASSVHIDYNYNQNDTTQLINQHNTAVIGGGYVEMELDPNNKWHIQPGLRNTYYAPTGKFYTEPRLSFTYHLNDSWNIKGATGRFYQFTNQVIREDIAGGDRNFWVMANNSNIPVSSADHYIAGFNYETDKFLFDVEGYYKKLNGLTEYSIRQQGGGGGLFGGNNSAITLTQNFYQGEGYAKGIEFLLQKKAGMYTGWISYTLAQAKSKFPIYGDNYFSSPQDITHEVKYINMYHWQRWSFAATFIFSTGHPYTAPLGTYTIQTLDGNKTTYLTISDKNGERLPDYHRLDLSATYDLLKVDGIKVGSIGLSLFNIYNHINSWYNQYYIRNNIVYTTAVKYLGFTPNLTLSLKWK